MKTKANHLELRTVTELFRTTEPDGTLSRATGMSVLPHCSPAWPVLICSCYTIALMLDKVSQGQSISMLLYHCVSICQLHTFSAIAPD